MFRPLISKFALSRFSRIFSSLNASGLPIMQTLAISKETVGNVYYGRFLGKVTEEVKRGETTGKLDEVLCKVSDYHKQGVDYDIKRF